MYINNIEVKKFYDSYLHEHSLRRTQKESLENGENYDRKGEKKIFLSDESKNERRKLNLITREIIIR